MAETIGEQLRKAREERKLTLEQVFQATHISVRYLQGLENGQREALPSPVQAKGFLRLYAGFLNLPVQSLLDRWDGKLPVEATAPAEPVETEMSSATATEGESAEPAIALEVDEEPEEEPAAVIIDTLPQEAGTGSPPVGEKTALPASKTIFREIGQQLLIRRESLGLSLADVEHYTRLRKHYLLAMEDGRMHDLPSLVQGRGMLSNYSRFLELDAEAMLLRFAEALQERRVEILPPPPRQRLFSRKRRAATTANPNSFQRLITPDLLIGGLVILVLLGIAIWGAAQVSAMRALKAAPTAPSIANVLLITPTPEATMTVTGQPRATGPAQAAGLNPVEAQPPAGEITPTALPVIGDAPLQVYVVANQRAWLRVSEDGKVKFNGRVIPGNAYPFSGKVSIELVTGNAAALRVFFNQQDMGSLGQSQQVVQLIFTAEGVITPTPSFSATPTNTVAPSLTPKPSPTQPTSTVTPYIP